MVMILRDAMKHVPAKWLIILHSCLLLIDVALIGGYVFQRFAETSEQFVAFWGLTPGVVVIAAVHLIYGATIYPWFRHKNIWYANLISIIIMSLVFATLIETSGNVNYVYRVGWIALIGFSAFLGSYVVIALIAGSAVLEIFAIVGVMNADRTTTIIELLMLLAAAGVGLGAWLICRAHYSQPENTPVKVLSGKLQQEQLKSEFLINAITDGVVVIDTNGYIQLINPAGARMIGWDAKEALGLDYHSLFRFFNTEGKDEVELNDKGHPFAAAIATGHPVSLPAINLATRDTKQPRVIVSLTVSPIMAGPNEVSGAVAVYRDVSEEKRQERQRTEFISTASHEMRTPIAAIEGYLSLTMNEKVCKIDTKAREFLVKAHDSTQHLGELFRDLLAASKSEDGRLENHPKVIELGEFLERIVEEARFSAQKKGLRLDFLVAAQTTRDSSAVVRPLYYVHVDPDRMREVLTNLINNAIKFTEQGGVTVGLRGEPAYVQVSIKDSGVGIPEADIPHLFQKFYRVDSSATRTIGGTGLGLFISRNIVELYKGQIWVESKLGEGSTFFINLPRLDASKAEEMLKKEAAETTPLSNIPKELVLP